MDLLNINIDEYIEDIIDVYSEVLGSEYKSIIEKRVRKTGFAFYNDEFGISMYKNFVKSCKEKEYAIKFLKQIGVDISDYEKESYAEKLDKHIENLLNGYVGGVYGLYNSVNSDGIKAFEQSETFFDDAENDIMAGLGKYLIRKKQINFLNFYRSPDASPITDENYDEFKKTSEYQKIISDINKYLEIKEKILNEYKESEKEFEAFDAYIESEKKRVRKIYEDKKQELFKEIYTSLPKGLLQKLEQDCITIEEMCNKIFLGKSINNTDYIEFFSREKTLELESDSTNKDEKEKICYMRMRFFENLGIDIGNRNHITVKQYEEFIQNDEMKELVPSEELIQTITNRKHELRKEVQREDVYGNPDFIEIYSHFIDAPEEKEGIYKRISNRYICINTFWNNEDCFPIIFLCVRAGDEGSLDYSILHEILHAIEMYEVSREGHKTGFEFSDEERNSYDSKKRKYEMLNETIVDIFAIEARELLHKKGIYIMEPKELVIEDISNHNTSNILKNMLAPFISKYRKEVINAKVTGNIQELFNNIGRENFENLNDVINKVDDLIDLGLKGRLEKGKSEDTLVKQYNEQLLRLEQIYANMELQYSKYNRILEEH